MNYPKISIVTPSYNQVNFLEETIKSVLNQGYPNLEYIIIDGGSTDGSVDVIKKYESKLSYWISEKDDGLYHAIDKGFSKSTGDIMGWLNSDDLSPPKSLFTIAEIFSSLPKVSWITGMPCNYDEYGRIVLISNFKRWSKLCWYTGDYKWIQQESTFWRRSLWSKSGAGINVDLKLAADFELWTRFFQHDKLYSTRAILGGFRSRSKNQKSLDLMKDYLEEVSGILSSHYSKEDEEFRRKVKKIKFYQNILFSVPVLKDYKRIENYFNGLKEFPPEIVFHRKKQSFELS